MELLLDGRALQTNARQELAFLPNKSGNLQLKAERFEDQRFETFNVHTFDGHIQLILTIGDGDIVGVLFFCMVDLGEVCNWDDKCYCFCFF